MHFIFIFCAVFSKNGSHQHHMWLFKCKLTRQNWKFSFSATLAIFQVLRNHMSFPGGSDGKVSVYNAGDPCSIPGLGRSPGEGNGNQPTPVLLPGKSHGQRSLACCSPWGHKESDTTSLSLFKEPHVANSYHIGQGRYRCVHHHRKFCCWGLFLLSGVISRKSSFLPHLYQPVTKACSSPYFGLLRMIESCNNDPQYCLCSDTFLKSPQSFKLKEARYI